LHHLLEYTLGFILGTDEAYLSGDRIVYLSIVAQIGCDDLFRSPKLFMLQSYKNLILALLHDRGSQPEIPHSLECGVKPFANILVWGVFELIQKTNDLWIPRRPFIENV